MKYLGSVFFAGIMLLSFQGSSQDYHFRSVQSGTWAALSTWEVSSDSINWIPCDAYPTSACKSVTINEGHLVNVASSHTSSRVIIKHGAALEVSLNRVLTVSNSIGYDLIVDGNLSLKGKVSLSSPSTGIVNGKGVVHVEGVESPLMKWEDGSTLEIANIKAPFHWLNQSFFNLLWDCNQPIQQPVELNLNNVFEVRGLMKVYKDPIASVYDILMNSTSAGLNFKVHDLTVASVSLFMSKIGAGPVILDIDGDLIFHDNGRLEPGASGGTINIKGDILVIDGTGGINKRSTTRQKAYINFTGSDPSVVQQVNNAGDINLIDYRVKPYAKVNFVTTLNLPNQAGIVGNKCIVESNGQLSANTIICGSASNLVLMDGASLITHSPVQATIERTMNQVDLNFPFEGWTTLSSPVSSQSLDAGGFITMDADGYDFRAWDEPNSKWLDQKLPLNNISSFTVGKGYFVAYKDWSIKTFSGNLNVASIPFNNLSFNGNIVSGGYHLLGNPFSSAITWDHVNWYRYNISDVAHVWDEKAGNYLPITGKSSVIPAFKGFFVQVTAPVNALTIPAAAKVHDITSAVLYDQNKLHLRVTNQNSGRYDEAIVRSIDDAKIGYDYHDGHKIIGSNRSPQLYTTIAPGESASVNSYPNGSIPNDLQLYFSASEISTFTLKVLSLTINRAIYLEDRKENETILLGNDTEYHFNGISSDNTDRFILHFAPVITEKHPLDEINIYNTGGTLYLSGTKGIKSIAIHDTGGRLLFTGFTDNDNLTILDISRLSKGVYIVTVYLDSKRVTRKIIL